MPMRTDPPISRRGLRLVVPPAAVVMFVFWFSLIPAITAVTPTTTTTPRYTNANWSRGGGDCDDSAGRAMPVPEDGPSSSSSAGADIEVASVHLDRRRRRQQEEGNEEAGDEESTLFPLGNDGARANTKRGRGRNNGRGRGRGWRKRAEEQQQQEHLQQQLGRQAAPAPAPPPPRPTPSFGGFGAAIIPGPAPPLRAPSASTSTSTATAFLTPTADTRGKDPRYMYCGTSWLDASSSCLIPCPGGGESEDECPGDTHCFAGVTRCAHSGNNDGDGASQQQGERQQQPPPPQEFHVGGGGAEGAFGGPLAPVIQIASDAFTLDGDGDRNEDDGLLHVSGEEQSSVLLEFEIGSALIIPRRPFSATLMLFVADVDGDDSTHVVTVSRISVRDEGAQPEVKVGNGFPVDGRDFGRWVEVNLMGLLPVSSSEVGGRLTLLLEEDRSASTLGDGGCTFTSGRLKSTLAPRLVLSPYEEEGTTSMTFLPMGDAYVRGGEYREKNYGSEVNLSIKSTANESYRRRAIIVFDLKRLLHFSSSSRLTGADYSSHSPFIANLHLYVAGVGPSPSRTVTVSRLPEREASGTIDEDTVTWVNLDPIVSTAERGNQFPVTPSDERGWVEVDVTRLLLRKFDDDDGGGLDGSSSSFILLLEDLIPPTNFDDGRNRWCDFVSREGDPALSPRLVVVRSGVGGVGPAPSPAPTRMPTTPIPTTSRPTTSVPSPKPIPATDPMGASHPTLATTPPPTPPPTNSPTGSPTVLDEGEPPADDGQQPFAAVPLPNFALVVFLRGDGSDLDDVTSPWRDGQGDRVMALMGATIKHLTRLLDGGNGGGRRQKLQSLSLTWTPVVSRRARGRRRRARALVEGEEGAAKIANVTVVVGGTAYYEEGDDDGDGPDGDGGTTHYHVPDEAEVAARVHRAFEGSSMDDFASSVVTGSDGGYHPDGGAAGEGGMVIGVRVAFSDDGNVEGGGDGGGNGNGPSSAVGSEEDRGGGGGLQRAMVPIGIVTAVCAVILILVLIAAKRRHNSLRTKKLEEGRIAGDKAFSSGDDGPHRVTADKCNDARYGGTDYSTCYADGNDDYNYSLCSGIGGFGGGGTITNGGGGASISSCSFDTSDIKEMHDLEDIEETIDKLQINVGEPGAPPPCGNAFACDVDTTTDEDGFTTSSCTSCGDHSVAPREKQEKDAIMHN